MNYVVCILLLITYTVHKTLFEILTSELFHNAISSLFWVLIEQLSMPYKHQLLIEERKNVITIIPWSSLCILFYVKCMSTSSFLKSRHHHHCALKTFWVCMCSSTRWVKVMNIYSFHRHFMTPVSTTLGNENERTYIYMFIEKMTKKTLVIISIWYWW
jgi:hypothetical protein